MNLNRRAWRAQLPKLCYPIKLIISICYSWFSTVRSQFKYPGMVSLPGRGGKWLVAWTRPKPVSDLPALRIGQTALGSRCLTVKISGHLGFTACLHRIIGKE